MHTVYIGDNLLIEWQDIADCTIHLSRNGGADWELIQANVITDLSEGVNPTGYCSFTWVATIPSSTNCVIRLTDNSNSTTLTSTDYEILDRFFNTSLSFLCTGVLKGTGKLAGSSSISFSCSVTLNSSKKISKGNLLIGVGITI